MQSKTAIKSAETSLDSRPPTPLPASNSYAVAKYEEVLHLSLSLVREVDNLMTRNLAEDERTRHLGNIMMNFSGELDRINSLPED